MFKVAQSEKLFEDRATHFVMILKQPHKQLEVVFLQLWKKISKIVPKSSNQNLQNIFEMEAAVHEIL